MYGISTRVVNYQGRGKGGGGGGHGFPNSDKTRLPNIGGHES